MSSSVRSTPDGSTVVAQIEGVVAELERAQQNESVDDFVGLMRTDAVWVTAMGKRLTGRDDIEAFTASVLPGAMRESTAIYTVEHLVFVRPDVAVVNVRQRPVTLDGDVIEGAVQGSPTYVLAREDDGRWLIVAGQNTRIADPDTIAAG